QAHAPVSLTRAQDSGPRGAAPHPRAASHPISGTMVRVTPDLRRYVLTLSCPDATGIVARITGFLAGLGGWITEAAYHSDPESDRFFTRQAIRADSLPFGVEELRRRFGEIATELNADHA